MQGRRLCPPTNRPQLVYHRAALTHLAQVVVLSITLTTAFLTLSVLFALFALAATEALLVVVVPRSALFRESVDRNLERDARAAAAATRTSLLARMSDAHASELIEIEALGAEIRGRWASEPLEASESPDGSEAALERLLAVDRLLVTYVRLAIGHRRSAAAFSTERRAALDRLAMRLATDGAGAGDVDLHFVAASGPGSRALASEAAQWLARRRSVLAMRRATWAQAAEDRDAIASALATIADVVRWMHELCAVPADDPGRAEVDRVLAASYAALGALRRFEADVPVDPRVLTPPAELPALAPSPFATLAPARVAFSPALFESKPAA